MHSLLTHFMADELSQDVSQHHPSKSLQKPKVVHIFSKTSILDIFLSNRNTHTTEFVDPCPLRARIDYLQNDGCSRMFGMICLLETVTHANKYLEGKESRKLEGIEERL